MRHAMFSVALVLFALLPLPSMAGEAQETQASAPALGVDASKPISVNADSLIADLKAETAVYTGNVIVAQGDIRLHADRLTVSAPGGKASRMEVEGHVIVDSPSGQASGDTGIYDVGQQTLKLSGNVVLTKDANVLRGSALEVSMATGLAHLTAEGAGREGRVQGLFVPAQRGAATLAAPAENSAAP